MRGPNSLIAALVGVAFALTLTVSAAERLIPMGTAVGVRMFSDGIMVVGTTEVETEGEKRSPADEGGLEKGDIITHVNECEVGSAQQFRQIVSDSNGSDISIRANREGRQVVMELTPVISDGAYRLGVWIRDSMAGIGTMTYFDPDTGRFGALGHGVNDVDTGKLLPLESGAIMDTSIVSVKKGQSGVPGQLSGSFDVIRDVGIITANTEKGIFGVLSDGDMVTGQAMEAATPDMVKNGPAYILSNVDGDSTGRYEVDITKQSPVLATGGRDMIVKVTDKALLEKTGGIVQGMSGSPIIQNDKIIGAVTHVLVNDPTKGYGIFIQSMTEESGRNPSSES